MLHLNNNKNSVFILNQDNVSVFRKVSKGAKIRSRYNQVPHLSPSLALVQPSKTRSDITDNMLNAT